MKGFKKNKGNIATVILFVLAVMAYRIYFPSEVLDTDTEAARDVGSDLIKTLSQVERINFDPTLLSSPAYMSLIDTGAQVPESPVGRPNPFAPFGQN